VEPEGSLPCVEALATGP